jgi:hypothetical protein
MPTCAPVSVLQRFPVPVGYLHLVHLGSPPLRVAADADAAPTSTHCALARDSG